MADYRQLRVWQHAHALMLDTHRVASAIRGAAYVSLRSQMIRAAMSIPANIVEGRAQRSERDFARFLGYAIASARELDYHLLAARDIGVIGTEDYESLTSQLADVLRMLYGLIARLDAANAGTPAKHPASPPPPTALPQSSDQQSALVSDQRSARS